MAEIKKEIKVLSKVKAFNDTNPNEQLNFQTLQKMLEEDNWQILHDLLVELENEGSINATLTQTGALNIRITRDGREYLEKHKLTLRKGLKKLIPDEIEIGTTGAKAKWKK